MFFDLIYKNLFIYFLVKGTKYNLNPNIRVSIILLPYFFPHYTFSNVYNQ